MKTVNLVWEIFDTHVTFYDNYLKNDKKPDGDNMIYEQTESQQTLFESSTINVKLFFFN